MNTPNKLTVIRMIMVPFFLLSFVIEFEHHYLVSLILFCAAAITDFFDGQMARKYNLITDFGKFLDPLADKMLTTSALLGFVMLGNEVVYGAMWITFITLFREFVVSGIRLSAVSSGGKVIAANIWGKAKTVSQMVAIVLILLNLWLVSEFPEAAKFSEVLGVVSVGILWISALLTVISGVIYVIQNSKYIDFRK